MGAHNAMVLIAKALSSQWSSSEGFNEAKIVGTSSSCYAVFLVVLRILIVILFCIPALEAQPVQESDCFQGLKQLGTMPAGDPKKLEEALRRVGLFVLKVGRMPINNEWGNILKIIDEEFYGTGLFRAEGGRFADRRLHDGRRPAVDAVLDWLLMFKPTAEFPAERIEKVMGQLTTAHQFEGLDQSEKRDLADELIRQFWKKKGMIPRRELDFPELGISFAQWTGTANYREGEPLQKSRFHRSEEEAWRLQISIFEKTPVDEFFSKKKRENVERELAAALLGSMPLGRQRKEATRRVVEAIEKDGVLPKEKIFRPQFGILYYRWAGTGDYREGQPKNKFAMYSNGAKAWSAVRRDYLEATKHSPEKQREILRDIDFRIWDYFPMPKRRRAIRQWIADQTVFLGHPPSQGDLSELGLDFSLWFGVGPYKEGGPLRHRAINQDRLEADKILFELIEKRELTESFSLQMKRKILYLIENDMDRVKERSIELRTKKADLRVLNAILIDGKRPRGKEDFHDLGINSGEWAGYGDYNPDRGAEGYPSMHPNSKEAWGAVLKLLTEKISEGVIISDQIMTEVRDRAEGKVFAFGQGPQ